MEKYIFFTILLIFITIPYDGSCNLFDCNENGKGCLLSKRFSYEISPFRLDYPPTCPSEVYCHGPLLHTVQMAGIYKDSKTFVDMKMHTSPKETIDKFNQFMNSVNQTPSNDELKTWVEENFERPGSEFEKWTPNDWIKEPKFLEKIKDISLRQWASDLNDLWLKLGRRMTKDVLENTEHYSIIHVENPVIVPGGRFREFYYWDSYWIIRGLMLSEMFSTVKGMLNNFRSIIHRFGFIPNGGRIYYSARSQPPLLAAMIKTYVDTTGDIQFAKDSVEDLEREFQFWMNNHTVTVKGSNLATYGDKSSGPRPESYREDVETGYAFPSEEEKEEHYAELKAAAESGMDFSSRWFIKDGTNKGELKDLKTRSIIPVDLNAILYWNAKIISEYFELAGNTNKSKHYQEKANELLEAINNVLWHEDVGAWLDFDIINEKRRDYFCASNLFPLWTKAYDPAKEEKITESILQYIEKTGLDEYPGGVPNTLEATNEQWDYPNVWPPLQYAIVMGLDSLKNSAAKDMAYNWAVRWIRSNFMAYREKRAMYEKYSALELGAHGGGGEYELQEGFGWTNGVIMEFLDKYGQQVTASGE